MARQRVFPMTLASPFHKTLCWLAVAAGITTGWQPLAAQDQSAGAPSDDLTITIVEGDGGINNIKKGIATKPVVEVHDRNKTPLAGVLVTFTLPSSGPSGAFADGSQFMSVTTDAAGRASAVIRPNHVAGEFKITVHASYQGHTATTSISQTNAIAGAAGAGTAAGVAAAHSHLLITVAVIAGAAVAGGLGAYYGSRGSSGKTGTIGAAGTPSLGPPQ